MSPIGPVKTRPHQLKWLLLVGVTLLAAFFRLHRINSLPPGDGYDPAFYGLDALAILQGERPVFLTTNFGREVLFSYLVALCFAVLGAGTLAIHVTSAIIGIFTIPAVYLVAKETFSSEEGPLAQFGGLLAALTMAISYWHLNWSRSGVRAILVPLFAALTLYFLWRGLRTGSRCALVGCGLFLGLSMYTYQAARLLALLVLLGFASAVRSQRSFSRNDVANLVLVFAVALIVFAPLGHYFITHRGSFTQRIGQTLVLDTSQELSGNVRTLFDRLAGILLMFSIHGEHEPFSTIPGRPLLNPFLSAAFFLGIGISLLRVKRPPYLFLLSWLGLMIAPAILAQRGSVSKRAIGTLPAVAMLITVGLLVPYDALRRWTVHRPSPWSKVLSHALLIIVVAGLIYTGAVTYRDYFVIWGQDPNLFIHFEVGLSAIGAYIRKLPPEEPVYLSPVLPEHPSIVLHSELRQNVKGYNGQACLVLPTNAAHDTTYVIVPGEDTNSLDLLREYFPQGRIVDEGPLHYQKPYFLAYRVPAGAQVQIEPSHRMEANWDDKIGLLGYGLDAPTYEAGGTIHLTLYHRCLSEMGTNYTVFTHLLGPYNPSTDGPVWSQDDSEPCRRFYPTSSWDVGEIVIDKFTLPIPAEAPPGNYDLALGFYQWPTLERLPVLDVAGQAAADDVVTLGQIYIAGPE
jgi:hypothetical protein